MAYLCWPNRRLWFFDFHWLFHHCVLFHLQPREKDGCVCVNKCVGTYKVWWYLQRMLALLRNHVFRWKLTSISDGTVSWQVLCFHMSTHCPGPSRDRWEGEEDETARGRYISKQHLHYKIFHTHAGHAIPVKSFRTPPFVYFILKCMQFNVSM